MELEHLSLIIIATHKVSLRARMDKAKGYTLNTDMQLEAQLCRAQIDALEKESGNILGMIESAKKV